MPDNEINSPLFASAVAIYAASRMRYTAAILLLECAEDKMFNLLPREEIAPLEEAASGKHG